MKELCVVHLVRAKNNIETFHRFINSYQRNNGGVAHDFCVVFKGFNQPNELKDYKEILKSFSYISYEISDEGFDLTAYFAVAKAFKTKYKYFCFLNSFSEILDNDWLKKLYLAVLMPNAGIVGATGSWQSHNTVSKIGLFSQIKVLIKDHFNLHNEKPILKRIVLSFIASRNYICDQVELGFFPNPHIRTNAFMISSELINSIGTPKLEEKLQAYKVESGKYGISRQIKQKRKKLLIVGQDGNIFPQKKWNTSNTFWQSNQENLLISDNQTRDYQLATLQRRKLLSTSAWGSAVNIAKGINSMNYPKVSVCIPVRNGGEFLEAAVNSILNQTYINYELIIIDNASTDDTAQLVQQFVAKNDKIRFFRNKENIGLIENFNACLSKATGKYIKFLCADDKLVSNCLEQMICALETNESANLVTVGRTIINQNDLTIYSKSYSGSNVLIQGKEVINRCLFGCNYIGEPSATMFRKDSLVNGFNLNFPHLVDLEMYFQLLEHGDLVTIPDTLCLIRRHELQMTKSNIESGILVEDNVRLYDLYSNKAYINKTWKRDIERKILMAKRVWMCRKNIEPKRKNEILKSQSSRIIYFLFMPLISIVFNVYNIFKYEVLPKFLTREAQ